MKQKLKFITGGVEQEKKGLGKYEKIMQDLENNSIDENNLDNYTIDELLFVASLVNKKESLRGQIGRKINQELALRISDNRLNTENINRMFRVMPIEMRLNVIHQLVTVAAMSVGWGYGFRAGFLKAKEIIEEIDNKTSVPIVQYFCEVSLRRIQQEKKTPSIGMITVDGNINEGRLIEEPDKRISNEDKYIKKKIALPEQFKYYRAYFVAKDYITLLDSANIPDGIIHISREELDKRGNKYILTLEQLYNIKEAVDSSVQQGAIFDMSSLLLFLKNSNVDIQQVFPNVSAGDIQKGINLAKAVKEIEGRIKKIQIDKLQEVNTLHHKEVQAIMNIVNENEETFFDGFTKFKNDYDKAQKNNDYDGMIEAVDKVVSIKTVFNDIQFNQIQARVAEMITTLKNNNKDRRGMVTNIDFSEEEKQLQELYAEIDEMPNKGFNLDALKVFIDNEVNKYAAQEVVVLPYSHIDDNKQLTLFNDERIAELISFLHRPDIMSFIENDLDVNLCSLKLAEQIHFLNFLSTENSKGFDRIRAISEDDQINTQNFLRSFLSTSGDKNMGEVIFAIAEKLDDKNATNAIFAKYAEILDIISNLADEIKKYTEQTVMGEDLMTIEKAVLQEAKDLLVKFANKINQENYSPDNVLIDLEMEKADLFITLSIYKALNVKIGIKDLKMVVDETIKFNKEDIPIIQQIKKEFFDQYNQLGFIHIDTAYIKDKNIQNKINILVNAINIYKQNWEHNPDRARVLIEELFTKLETGEAVLKTYQHKKQLMSFLRIDNNLDGSVKLASFNSVDSVKGNAIGSALLNDVLEEFKGKKIVKAETTKITSMLPIYLDRFGFIGTGIKNVDGRMAIDIQTEGGVGYFKDYSKYRLIKEFDNERGDFNGDRIILKLSMINNKELSFRLNKIFNDKYVCTKLVIDKKTNEGYFAMEKVEG